jgi:hypothetical protein
MWLSAGIQRALQRAGQRRGQQPGRHGGVADQHAFVEEVVHVEGLVRADPRVDALVEETHDLGVRVRVEAAADLARQQPAPLENAGRVPRPGGQHDEWGEGAEASAPAAVLAHEPAPHADRPAAAEEHAVDPRVRHQRRARAERARDLGHVHALLGARRAAEGAVVQADAAAHVARRARDRPAQPARALEEELRVAAVGVLVVRLGVEDALGGLEVGLDRARPEAVEAEVVLPVREHALGRAPRHAAVDDRRAADAAALGEDDGRAAEDHRRAGVAVEAPDHGGGVGHERFGAVERALLEDEGVEPRVAEPRRGDGAAGAAAHHDRVGRELVVARERRADGEVRVREAVLGGRRPGEGRAHPTISARRRTRSSARPAQSTSSEASTCGC